MVETVMKKLNRTIKRWGGNEGDLENEMKAMKREMSEIKNRVDQLFKMIESIVFSNNEGKFK